MAPFISVVRVAGLMLVAKNLRVARALSKADGDRG
jgi:hypothetical protein